MSPSQVLGILWRRSWVAALTFLTALGVAAGVLTFVPGRYDAVATASIDPGRSDPIGGVVSASSTMIGITQGNLLSLVSSERVALAVVKQLNLAADPSMQENFRTSEAFGRIPIETWIADQLLLNIEPRFMLGTNVLSVKVKSNSAQRSALLANAFLSATIDAAIAMKAASSDQTARWFAPQIEALKTQLAAAKENLESFQQQATLLAPLQSGDSDNSQLMSVTQDLSTSRAMLATLQARFNAQSVDTNADPSDPDLQVLSALKNKLATAQSDTEALKSSLGANNPKVVAEQANIKSVEAQIIEATKKMKEHLLQRIDSAKVQIKSLEAARAESLKGMIGIQSQRDKLADLMREVQLSQEQLEAAEKSEASARLQAKLSFSDIEILDKATPPAAPAFPKPLIVISVAIAAGLSLGLILALIAEMLDRRIRYVEDLAQAAAAPVLGAIAYKRIPERARRLQVAVGASRR